MAVKTSLWMPGSPSKWRDVVDGTFITPTPPAANTFSFSVGFGGNDARGWTKNQSYDAVVAALGRSDIGPTGRAKFFDYGNGIQAAVDNHLIATSHYTGANPVYCIKAYTAGTFNSFMDGLTSNVVLVWDQEFYTTVPADWTTYNNHYATLKGLRDAHVNGYRVELMAVSRAYEERQNPGFFTYANPLNFDSWGADTYNAKSPPYSPDAAFDAQITAYQAMKLINPALKWRISEYGISRYKVAGSTLWTGQERIDYMSLHINYIKDIATSLTYWATDNSDVAPIKDWSIDKGTAADVAFCAYLNTLISTYP